MATVVYVRPNFIDLVLSYLERETDTYWLCSYADAEKIPFKDKDFYYLIIPNTPESKVVQDIIKICVEDYKKNSLKIRELFLPTGGRIKKNRLFDDVRPIGITEIWSFQLVRFWFLKGYFDIKNSNVDWHDIRRLYFTSEDLSQEKKDQIVEDFLVRYRGISIKRNAVYLSAYTIRCSIKSPPGNHLYYVTDTFSFETPNFIDAADLEEVDIYETQLWEDYSD